MTNTDPASGRRSTLKIVLIIATILYGTSLLPAAGAALMSPMAFDAGVSREAVFLVSTVLAYPVLVLIALVGGWISYAREWRAATVVFLLLPLLDALVLVGGVIVGS